MKYITKNISLLIVLFVLIILTISCSIWENPAEPLEENQSFAIYFLKDQNIKIGEILEVDLSELILDSKPWISDEDIEYYDWSSHCIYLKKDKTHYFPNWKNDEFTEFPPEWADKPFLVLANDQRCYMGFFGSALSHYWVAPEIFDGYNNGYPSDILFIDWSWLYHDSPQNNQDVKDALINTELYRGGISVTFDTTDAILNIDNADTSTITYKFTITNNDMNNLYVLDPDKMGTELFHRFTNGPVFQNLETKRLYESRWKVTATVPSLDYWSLDWLTKLKPGQSIQKTVLLKGYPYFPTGEYIFQFSYSGKILGMEKDVRELQNGNLWVGITRSNTLVMDWKTDNDSLNRKNVTKQYFKKNKPQKIYEMSNSIINEYLSDTPTPQQIELKRSEQ